MYIGKKIFLLLKYGYALLTDFNIFNRELARGKNVTEFKF